MELGQTREAWLDMTPYELSVLYDAYLKKQRGKFNLGRDMVLNAVANVLSGNKRIEPFIPSGDEDDMRYKKGKMNTVATQEDLLEFERKLQENENLERKIRLERDSLFDL